MQKDPFVTLGVSETVTQNELYEAYKAARSQWESKRFEPGETGAEACEKLDEIEEAYRSANEILQSRYYVTTVSDKLEEADNLIKSRRYDEAQSVLDGITEKTAEWHFLQSIILYSKRRSPEAVEQLRLAVQMEPGNAKYTSALKQMEAKMHINANADGGAGAGRSDGYQRSGVYNYRDDGGSGRSYSDDESFRRGGRGMTPCDCCTSLICADCCCECMGGDLISCC